jgi:hypothetical protein
MVATFRSEIVSGQVKRDRLGKGGHCREPPAPRTRPRTPRNRWYTPAWCSPRGRRRRTRLERQRARRTWARALVEGNAAPHSASGERRRWSSSMASAWGSEKGSAMSPFLPGVANYQVVVTLVEAIIRKQSDTEVFGNFSRLSLIAGTLRPWKRARQGALLVPRRPAATQCSARTRLTSEKPQSTVAPTATPCKPLRVDRRAARMTRQIGRTPQHV